MQDATADRKSNHFHKEHKDPNLPYPNGIRSLLFISKGLKYGLIAFVPLTAFQTLIVVYALIDLDAYLAFYYDLSSTYPSVDWVFIGVSMIHRLVYLYCIVFSSWLLFRAARNIHTVAPGQMKTQPHWAWLWFFIPIANFFKPYESVIEIDRITRENTGIGPGSNPLIITWWVLFIGAIFFGSTVFTLPGENMIQISLSLELVAGVAAIIAAILIIRITSDLAQNQQHLQVDGVAHVFD